MNKDVAFDSQPMAGSLLRYTLLDVKALRITALAAGSERNFIEPSQSHMLLLSVSHGGNLVIDGHLHALRPGTLFLCAPGQLIELTNFAGLPFELLLLEFEVSAFPPGPSAARFPYIGEATIPSAAAAAHLFDTLRSNWNRDSSASRLRCEAGLLELLSLVLSYQEQKTAFALESARLELERRYKEEITIDSLAAIAGLSRYHFMRLFKDRYGKGVSEYRTELRLTEAKRLMEGDKPLPISQIVYEVGFKNEAYFSSLFKKETGVAPAVYQRNQKLKVAAYSWINFGQLLALQIIPFAAPMDHYWTDMYRNKYKYEVKVPLSHRYDYNYNALRQAQPDYIIGIEDLIPPEERARLNAIAPALFLRNEDDWRRHLIAIAELLGKQEEARKWLTRYDRKAAATKESLSPLIRQDALLVLLVCRDQLYVWGRRAGTVLYDDLGIPAPKAISDLEWKRPIQPQELAEVASDRILLHVEDDDAAQALWNRVSQSEVWRELSPVRNNKIHLAFGYSCFEAPWSDYAASQHDIFLSDVPRLFSTHL
ncbi:AraC family transcriptional regulator [Paenibacillus sp. BC26]|uniref:AraC family transcriptional regulator n=1 Tax=Paenibacillus sp. BC26 TaxID=1881032 RepID=UPI0008E38CCC|nr:AraC family transcriptional regulator [Paenibacillus sp. BC26]SFT27093.1 transcriptional regulator of bacillibactin transport [Paenibacillus sp. BC26]